jgi:GntR family transcriptional regulator
VEIDHDGETPIYLQLAAILRVQIASGELAPGRPIPSEKSLMQQYEVSRGTAAKAVKVLRDEGLLRVSFGRGTFVATQKS